MKQLDAGEQPSALSKIKEVLLKNYSHVGKYDDQIDFERAMFKALRSKDQNAHAVQSSLPVNFLETRSACIVSSSERPSKTLTVS